MIAVAVNPGRISALLNDLILAASSGGYDDVADRVRFAQRPRSESVAPQQMATALLPCAVILHWNFVADGTDVSHGVVVDRNADP